MEPVKRLREQRLQIKISGQEVLATQIDNGLIELAFTCGNVFTQYFVGLTAMLLGYGHEETATIAQRQVVE